MRVLVLSNTPWNNNNSFGNTYSNIFHGMEDVNFLNIYCQEGVPNTELRLCCFQMTTKLMARSIVLRKTTRTGREVFQKKVEETLVDSSSKMIYNFAKKNRWLLFFWIRELIWKLGNWKSKELQEFLDKNKPDVIFQPIYGQGYAYINRIALFIKKYTGAPMFGYISDDCYSLRQFSLSPLYWIDRIFRRKILRAVMRSCNIVYVATELQKSEYEKMLGIKCKVLTKGISEQSIINTKQSAPTQTPVKFIYAGNLSAGRWKSLALIGKTLDNFEQGVAELFIYTSTQLSCAMKKELNSKSIHLMAPVEAKELSKLYSDADICVYVESISLQDRLLVRHSFSTKLVDYFAARKCIFVYGPSSIGSILHLQKHDAAIIANTPTQVIEKLSYLLTNRNLIREYGDKAQKVGIEYHRLSSFQRMLRTDFTNAYNVISQRSNRNRFDQRQQEIDN